LSIFPLLFLADGLVGGQLTSRAELVVRASWPGPVSGTARGWLDEWILPLSRPENNAIVTFT
jgi:hypothetical protein